MCGWGVPAWHLVVDDFDACKLLKTCWERSQFLMKASLARDNTVVTFGRCFNYLARLRVLVSNGNLDRGEGIKDVQLSASQVSMCMSMMQ